MFDKNKFAQILKNINDTYSSQRDFSKKSEINRTYLSQYMNMKLDEPPKPSILQKLANHSNGITDYEDLMIICGYINKNMELSEKSKKIFNKYLPSLKELNLNDDLLNIMYKMSIEPSKYSKDFDALVFELPKEIQDKVYIISSKILTEINEMMRNAINNIKILSKYDVRNFEPTDDPLGLAKIGFNMKDYNPPTETQKEQIKIIIETILKDNKKKEDK